MRPKKTHGKVIYSSRMKITVFDFPSLAIFSPAALKVEPATPVGPAPEILVNLESNNLVSSMCVGLSKRDKTLSFSRTHTLIKKAFFLFLSLSPVMGSGLSYYSYVTNTGDGTVSVINEANTIISTISVGRGTFPTGVAFSPEGRMSYVINYGSNSVSVIDTSTDMVTGAPILVGEAPFGVAFNPKGNQAYVTNSLDNDVSVINPSNNTVSTTIGAGDSPKGVAFSCSGEKAYIANSISNTVSIVKTKDNLVCSTINVGITPRTVAFNPHKNEAYVANQDDDNVSVINTKYNTVRSTIGVGDGPIGVAFSLDGKRAYITNNDSNSPSTVSVINTRNKTISSTINVGSSPFGVAVSPDGREAFVTNEGDNTVSVIDTSNDQISNTIPVGTIPMGVAFSPLFIRGIYITSGDKQMTQNGMQRYFLSFAGGTLQASKSFKSERNVYLSNGIAAIAGSGQGGVINPYGHTVTLCGVISGPGGLTVNDSTGKGKLILTNTYTGGTTITSGTLQLGKGGKSGSITGDVVDNAKLVFDRSDTYTFSGVISGTGSAKKKGEGKLILTNTNTYSGGTIMKRGILQIGSDAALGTGGLTVSPKKCHTATLQAAADITMTRPIMVLGNGGIFDPDGHTLILNEVISGKGGVTLKNHAETGSLILAAANTYTGSTHIKKGILQMGIANALSKSTAVKVEHRSTFDLNNFDQSIGSLLGSGAVRLGTATLTTGNNNKSTTFKGTIEGTGGLTKVGKRTFTLSGKNTYTGATTIDGGKINLTGSIRDSDITVNMGGKLTGTGTMKILKVEKGGKIAPGNSLNHGSFGALSMAGDSMGDSSFLDGMYSYKINAKGKHDLISNKGPVMLGDTSKLKIEPQGSPKSYTNTETYTVLTASEVIGRFEKIKFPKSFASTFKHCVTYGETDILLTLFRKANVVLEGVEGNAGAIVPAFDELVGGEADKFDKALLSLPTRDAMENGIQALGSPQNGVIGQELAAVSIEKMDEILKHMRSPIETNGELEVTSGFMELLNHSKTPAQSMIKEFFKNQEKSKSRDILFGIQEHRQSLLESFKVSTGRTSLWIHNSGGNFHEKAFEETGTRLVALRASTYIIQTGIDYQLNKCVLVGATSGYNHTHYHGGLSHGHIDAYNLGLYGQVEVKNWYLEGVALYTHNDIKGAREIKIPGYFSSPHQKHQANEGDAMIEAGYDFKLAPHMTLTPFINGAVVCIKEKGYEEPNSGNLGLHVTPKTRTAVQGKVGGQVSKLLLSGCTELYGYLKLSYTYRKTLKRGVRTTATFVNQELTFTVTADTKSNNLISPAVGLTALFKNGVYCTLSYNGDFGARIYENIAFFRVGVRF